jgi:hypothetical protein
VRMTTPWFKIEKRDPLDVPAGPGSEDYIWQAQFACQVNILPYHEWIKLKWGFNASALFDEFFERQKLFLESQYEVRHHLGSEAPDYRTLTFRFINRPGEGLLVAILGKIHAKVKEKIWGSILAYYNDVKSTFPYDYTLVPAQSSEEFQQMSGWNILNGEQDPLQLAQIKRMEIPLSPVRNSPFLQGFWRSSPRAHEQIWRALASSPDPLLLSISLRCTVLYEGEREKLLRFGEEISSIHNQPLNHLTLSGMQAYNRKYVERRLAPWTKLYYLQVHLASHCKLSGDLLRAIGTSLTLNSSGETLPGYQVIHPDQMKTQTWQKNLKNLDTIFSDSNIPVARLSEVADLEEVFAVLRLPYCPPENGLPNVTYISTQTETMNQEEHRRTRRPDV